MRAACACSAATRRRRSRGLDGVAGLVEAPRFYPYLSGRRNLELMAAYDGGDARARIDAAPETVDLADRARHKVGGYSHGMRQRIGIAAALLRAPRLLVLDEPATGLDPAGVRDMRSLIRRLADGGMTVLLSSHQLAEVEELCDRVAIVREGAVVYEGSLADPRAAAGGGYLLPDQFAAWQGPLRDPIDWAPIARAAWVSALYALPCLLGAAAVFRRRDVAGG